MVYALLRAILGTCKEEGSEALQESCFRTSHQAWWCASAWQSANQHAYMDIEVGDNIKFITGDCLKLRIRSHCAG